MQLKNLLIAGLATLSATITWADWEYKNSTDPMTGKESRFAHLTSENSLSLDSPYSGTNHGTLTVRQHAQYGKDVIFQVQKGQILCRLNSKCAVLVRFDDGKPVTFAGVGPEDNDSKLVFLRNPDGFINAAKKAKAILVQVGMYQSGNQVLTFKTSKPLEWGAPSAKTPKP